MREKSISALIEREIGAEPDLLLIRNSVGVAEYVRPDGRAVKYKYGLGVGTPDLVGILAPRGVWFCLEIKTDTGARSPEQIKMHAVWKRFGALVYTVRSAKEARVALEQARMILK